MDFLMSTEIKQEFLNEMPTDTALGNASVLRIADEYENLLRKNIYDMSFSELDGLLLRYNNPSRRSVSKNVSILRQYIDYCISKGFVRHMENRLTTYTGDKLDKFISKQAMEYRYITPEELREYQNILENEQDKLLIQLPYLGIRGRTVEGGTLEEIINLQVNERSEDFKNNLLKLVKNNGRVRYVKVSNEVMKLVLDTLEQESYAFNNGVYSDNVRGGIRRADINRQGNYVFRVPGKNKNELFNPVLINSRIKKIQDWVGNRFLTINSLYMSGMITAAKNILAEKGQITTEDYIDICRQFEYGGDTPDRYWYILKDTVEHYI